MQEKINKRVLIVEDHMTNLYIVESLKSQFDEVIIISDYMKPVSELTDEERSGMPTNIYNPYVTPDSPKPLKIRTFNKVPYAKMKDIDLGSNNAFFVVGKLSWYFIRDLQTCHIGLRATSLDWQIVHLEPFSMESNKFVFCHNMVDEHYKKHIDYFFDDNRMLGTVKPLPQSKILVDYPSMMKALTWGLDQPVGTRFGLDYESNGLWRGDKYEAIEAIGVGIATTEYGFYIDFRYISEGHLEAVKVLYREFLEKHHLNIWVFNIGFELMLTRKFLGEWAIYDFRDADIFRIIYGNQVGYSKKIVEDRRARGTAPKFKEIRVNRDQYWSLKYTAQKYLNVESWDNEFEWIENKFYTIFNGFEHDNVNDFLQNPIVGNMIHSWIKEGDMTEVEVTKLLKSLCAFKKIPSYNVLKSLFKHEHEEYAKAFIPVILGCKTVKQVKAHPFYKDILGKYPEHAKEFDTLLGTKKYFGNGFAIQPSDVVGKYCIIDSFYTLSIAEKYYEKDEFNHDPENPDKVPAKWMTSQKMIDIFAGNKAIGAKLHMYGLNKSNTRRDKYNDIQWKARVHSNYVVALAYYQMLLSSDKLEAHASNDLLHPVFKSVISKGGNPMDFGRVTKVLFPHIYDPSCEFGWNETRASELLGDIAEEVKSVLLTHKPKGFENPSAHSRALNLHKEAAALIEETWSFQELPDNFNWLDIKKYYTDLAKLDVARSKLADLGTCSIKGMHMDDLLNLDSVSINGEAYNFKQFETILKKQYYDLNSNNEMVIGAMTERWKTYKTLLFLYHPAEYKGLIDELNLWNGSDSVFSKSDKFKSYMDDIINVYEKINFIPFGSEKSWEVARRYARNNEYPDVLKNPVEEDMSDNLQVTAYLDRMLSHDLMKKHKVSIELMNQYVWYQSLTEEDIMTRKGFLLDEKHMSVLSYKNWMLSTANLGKLHDNLDSGNMDSWETTDKLAYADFDVNSDHAYVQIAMAFKMNRRYNKLNQYLDGQLVKDDDRLIGVGSDGVPEVERLSLDEKLNSSAGDDVRMFPRYDIMQKATKRNSSGIHTVPARNQVKSVIEAPKGSFLVYTDISGLELRGISAVSGDPVMQKVFDDGIDLYSYAAYCYYVEYLGKDLTMAEVRKKYRGAFKQGIISSIYTAGDFTLATGYDVPVHEVREINKAIFDKFQRLYEWQQSQISWNKANRNRIKTFLGDIRTTWEDAARQTRQSVNLDIQGTCSLICTSGFNNLLKTAVKKKMVLNPAIIVH